MAKSNNNKTREIKNCCKCDELASTILNKDFAFCEKHWEEYKRKYGVSEEKLERKFVTDSGEEIEYSSPFSVNNQIYFCGVPFRLDTYSGCSHMCKYCFVRAAELTSASRDNRGQWIIAANPQDIKRDLVTALDTGSVRESINIEWLRHRVPIHWGGMSDPFQLAEKKFGVSKKIMELLSWYKYPTVISSKGMECAEPEYLELLKQGNYAYQVSLVSDDDEFVKALEPGAPSASERLRLLELLANNGIWTAVRIQPVIPNSPVERGLPKFVKRLSEIGVKFIVTESYKVPVRAEDEKFLIWDLCPEALKEYQYNDVKSEGFELLLPSWRKWQYVKVMKQLCTEYNILYGCGDNDMRDFGDVVCCCGIDNIPGFENFWRYQASQAAQIAKQKGFVTLEDMQQFWHGEKSFSIHNVVLRLQRKRETGMSKVTPKYAIDETWLRGDKAMSPACIFSMKASQRDGQLVYERIDAVPLLEAMKVEQQSMF